MKKNPFAAFLKSPWAIPVFTVAGLIIGAGLAFAAMRWIVPTFFSGELEQATTNEKEHEFTETNKAEVPYEQKEAASFAIIDRAEELNISWQENARKLSEREIHVLLTAPLVGTYEATPVGEAVRRMVNNESEQDAEIRDFSYWNFQGIWEVGTVQDGPWSSAAVYHLRLEEQTLGGGYHHWYLIRPRNGSPDLFAVGEPPEGLKKETWIATSLQGVSFLPNVSIRGLEVPKELTLQNGNIIRQDERRPFGNEKYRFDSQQALREVARTRDGRIVYEYREQSENSEQGCLVIFAPDGEQVTYRSAIPSEASGESFLGIAGGGRVAVTWETAYIRASTTDYVERLYGGCGGYACTAIVSDQKARAGGGLTVAGTTKEGDPVYVPTDLTVHPTVQELYDGWYIPDGGDKPSIEEMIQKYPAPVFYWQDALGRWVEYRALGILPLAECGKPVIYLYPEQTTDISVRLPSFIDVTVSEPTYPANGWRVTAQPNGQLTSHDDGNTYGSLYWEGTGVGYAPPKDGFIVKDGEVESFLRNTLPRYGLNQTETREFMEFWVPEMQGAPYYRVSFLTSAWSAAAPLFVSPQPQTSIRIFMDWRPLSAPVSLPEPEITTPARNGFTLVEWGGTLWK